jgi:ABC-type lipoprotein export system ATPase subunit
MKSIQLNRIQPPFLASAEQTASEIWFKDTVFEKGECYLLSASSGAGKTSLFSYLFGERKDYKGQILFDEQNIASFKENEWHTIRKTSVSHVFQDLRLFDELTVMENIELKNSLTDCFRKSLISQWLEHAGIADKTNIRVEKLSYGQKQRTAIIRALCQPFDFLLLDEPFSHLDNNNIEIMTEIISEEITRRRAGLIVCSLGEEYGFDYTKKLNL